MHTFRVTLPARGEQTIQGGRGGPSKEACLGRRCRRGPKPSRCFVSEGIDTFLADRVQGNERSLVQEARWGKLLIKVLQAVSVDKLALLGSSLLERGTLVELSLHPHASLVIQALISPNSYRSALKL